jgi:molecular chaperone DnaJ
MQVPAPLPDECIHEVTMTKDYYLILGIGADATREDVKAAYRRCARELHPDRCGLGSGPFLEAQEAYSVLSDPVRRRGYDREYARSADYGTQSEPGRGWVPTQRGRAEPLRSVEFSRRFQDLSIAESFESYRPSFEELFDRFWSNFEEVNHPKSEGIESLTVEVVLSPEEAAWGGHVRVWIPGRSTCRACGGQGAIGWYECWQCEGRGAVTTEYPVDVEYPPGVSDGYAVRIPLTRFGVQNLYLTALFRVS